MSTLIAKGNWNIVKGKLKQLVARLIHDDREFVDGKVDELVGRIQKRAGMRRKRMDRAARYEDVDEERCRYGHR